MITAWPTITQNMSFLPPAVTTIIMSLFATALTMSLNIRCAYARRAPMSVKGQRDPAIVARTVHTFQPWFHGRITREHAELCLQTAGHVDGLFLLVSRRSCFNRSDALNTYLWHLPNK